MKKFNMLATAILFGISASNTALAQSSGTTDISILPVPGPNMGDVVVDSNLTLNGGDTTILDIYTSCFGTNLRSVANPVSPASTITARIQYLASDNSYKIYEVSFPAAAALIGSGSLNSDLTSTSKVTTAAGVKTTDTFTARLRDKLIRIGMKKTKAVGLDILASSTDFGGLKDLDTKGKLIKSVSFIQTMPNNSTPQQYMGWNGPLSASVRWYASENGKHYTIYAAFPGQEKFCGGYHSPLMLKFADIEEAPLVEGTSHFYLYETDFKAKAPRQKISWPSFKAKENVYFLAIDLNKNGLVDHGGELLGDVNGHKDGFANLEIYDKNKDGLINEKDAIFKDLVLWKDKNNDGVSSKKEVSKLSEHGVFEISLTYTKEMRAIGDKAQILGPGEFSYKNKKGEIKKGSVWDIFMKSVP